VPGFGDAAGAILAAAILVEAIRSRIGRATLVRMATNITIDAVVGSVPLLGDIFDAAWKANLKNLALLERHLATPSEAKRADRLFVIVLCGSLLVLCGVLVTGGAVLTVAVLRGMLSLLGL
jgi:hypothetical protein